ncbi:MAG: hypothetical protein AAGA54_17140 [Myxococcota bacterium]
MEALDRLLGLVCRDLGATRAWLEYASGPEDGETTVRVPLERGWTLCASFEEIPDRAEAQLQTLAGSFRRAWTDATEDAPRPADDGQRIRSQIRETLDALEDRIAATAIWVVDERSPIVWGSSSRGSWLRNADDARSLGETFADAPPASVQRWLAGQQVPPPPAGLAERLEEVRARVEQADDPDALLLAWSAIARACASNRAWCTPVGDAHALSRPFAGIYRVVAVFDDECSPMHAETTVAKAVPIIERLVADHPPIDPTPVGARVHMLRRPD